MGALKLMALGGGNEIGASCHLLKVDNIGILLDAGLRPRNYQTTPLFVKMFEELESWQNVKAILISHAHLDHCGSLPKAFESNKQARIYVPEGSLDFIKIQINSVLVRRPAGNKCQFKDDYSATEYAQDLVKQCLGAIIEVPYFLRKKIPATNIYFEFWPAGHILGSASIYIITRHGTVLYTGDICDIPKVSIPKLEYRPLPVNYLIIESTYLQHENMQAPREEFKHLFDRVKKVVAKGGNVLIPCFALGKAQEVAALFVEQNGREKTPVPLYLDGLVKKITEIYEKKQPSFKVIGQNHCDLMDRLAPDPRAFKKFIETHPGCVILSSSGMLHDGSKSAFWAEVLAPYADNAIYFTGYLDEESPGSRLLNAVQEKTAKINGENIPIACETGKFYLSTHAHAAELMNLIVSLQTNSVYFVHGNVPPRKISEFQMDAESTAHHTLQFQKVENYITYPLGESNE